jgi:hypothetical protein
MELSITGTKFLVIIMFTLLLKICKSSSLISNPIVNRREYYVHESNPWIIEARHKVWATRDYAYSGYFFVV